jgi:hypothetical protein
MLSRHRAKTHSPASSDCPAIEAHRHRAAAAWLFGAILLHAVVFHFPGAFCSMTVNELRLHFKRLANGAKHRKNTAKKYHIRERNIGAERAYRNAVELMALVDAKEK